MGSYTLETLTGWVSDGSSRVESVGGQLTQDRAKLQEGYRRLAQLQELMQQLQSAAAALRSQIASLESAARNQDSDDEDADAGVQSQISQLQGQLAQVESSISSVKGSISQTQAEISQYQQQISVHTAKLRQMDQSMGDVHSQLEEKYNERVSAKAKFSQISGIRFGSPASGAASQMQSAMNDCRNAQNQARSIQDRIRQLLDEGGADAQGRDPTLSADELRIVQEMESSGEMDDWTPTLNRSYYRPGTKLLTGEPIEIDWPYNPDATYSENEFIDQSLDQEAYLNGLTVADFIHNFETRRDHGRSKEGTKAQKQYAQGVREIIKDELRERGSRMSERELDAFARKQMKGGAALHGVDQSAGGSPTEIYSYGSGAANSALGSLWGHKRARDMYDRVMELSRGMTPEQRSSTYLNVRLNIHPKKK